MQRFDKHNDSRQRDKHRMGSILRMHRFDKHNDSRQRDKHRKGSILWMQWFDKHYDSQQREKHRRLGIPQMHKFDHNQLPRHKSSMASNRKGQLLGFLYRRLYRPLHRRHDKQSRRLTGRANEGKRIHMGPLFCAVCRQNAAKFLRGRCRKSAICFGFCKLRRKFSGRVEKGRTV